MLTLSVLAERRPRERRVAVVPSEVARLQALGLTVAIETGAGVAANFPDDAYRDAGVRVCDRDELLDGARLLAKVSPPSPEEVATLPSGSTLIGFLPPSAHLDTVRRLGEREVTSFSFDLVPRISRAQSMDALSSQASVSGYQAAVLSATRLGKLFPMMMTAAGTVPPARLLVMGAGVAGLQAVATARRLGAAVSAYDVRPEAAEEIRSLGATFVTLGLEAEQGEGGYAAEQSDDFIARQQDLIRETVARSDVVITAAAVPGRPAPLLLTTAMVEGMRSGSLVVDLAAASGGNCELTRDGEEIDHRGVAVLGAGDLASECASTASAMYARNVSSFLALLVRDGELHLNFDDEVVAASCVTTDGQIRHEPTAALLALGAP